MLAKLTTGNWIAIWAIVVPAILAIIFFIIQVSSKKKADAELRERVAYLEGIVAIIQPILTQQDARKPLAVEEKQAIEDFETEKQRLQQKYKKEIQVSVEAQVSYAAGLTRLAKYKEAEQAYRTILAGHCDNADAMNGLAIVLLGSAKYKEAEELFRDLLVKNEASFGTDHPNVATYLNRLAQLLLVTNRLDQAEPMMWRALKIDEASFGTDHHKVAIRLNNLAQLLKATNRLDLAEPMMRRALKILEDSLGTDHPSTKAIRRNLEDMR